MVASCARSTKAHLEFQVPFEQFYQTKLSGPDRYLQLLAEVGNICIPGSERSVDVNVCLGLASTFGNINLVNYFLYKGATNLSLALIKAAANGRFDIIQYLVSLIPKNRIIPINVLRETLNTAVASQHLQIVKYLIDLSNLFKQRDSSYDFPSIDDLNVALEISALVGNIQLFDYLVSLGANNLNNTLLLAAQNNQKKLVLHIIDLARKINYDLDLTYALTGAASGGSKELIDYLLIHPTFSDVNILNRALYSAAHGGQKGIIDYLLSLGANNINEILSGASYGGHRELVDYALSLGSVSCATATNLNDALTNAAFGGNIELLPYLISLGSVSCATAVNLNEALFAAIEGNQLETIKYILTQGSRLKQQYPGLILPTAEESERGLRFVG